MGPPCASVGKSNAQSCLVSLCELSGQIARAIVGSGMGTLPTASSAGSATCASGQGTSGRRTFLGGVSPELRGIAGRVVVWPGSLAGIAGRGQVHLQGARADRLAGQHGPAGWRDGRATGQKPGISAGPLSCGRCQETLRDVPRDVPTSYTDSQET